MVVERRSSLTIIGKIHSKLAFRPRGLRRPTIWSRLTASLCNRGITQPFYPARITPLASGWWKSYDIEKSVSSALTNVSTRGFVGTDQNVMIGGFITEGGNGSTELVVRGLGPTVTQFGVSGALADPALTLVDSNGNIVRSNNNWKDTQQVGNSGNGTGGAKRPGGGDSCNSHCRTLHRYSFGQRWWNGDKSG